MNHGNQAVLVATDIENHIAINIVGVGKMSSEFVKGTIVCLFDDAVPIFQRRLAIRMFADKLLNTFTSNDVHSL
jgi:hypothetical protein